jgi:hypothetical protein
MSITKNQRITLIFILMTLVITGLRPKSNTLKIHWKKLDEGLWYTEVKSPVKSRVKDKQISILKASLNTFCIQILTASDYDSIRRTAPQWVDSFGLTAVINAGMYSLQNRYESVGFMKTDKGYNNPNDKEGFEALACFQPKTNNSPIFKILDINESNPDSLSTNYIYAFQSLRMIDEIGNPVFWKYKRVQRCSMSVLAVDKQKNILFIFTRTPMSANEMSIFLTRLKCGIQSAIYLEGGPEASFFVRSGSFEIGRFGSYVSHTYATDKNDRFRPFPNAIGLKRK